MILMNTPINLGHSEGLTRRMQAEAKAIFDAGLCAAAVDRAITQHCRLEKERLIIGAHAYDLNRIDRIVVVGAGKASAAMARAVEHLLGKRISEGMISIKYGHGLQLEQIGMTEAGHPVPDINGTAVARRILTMVQAAGRADLVIVLLSGGGSALLPLPAEGLTLADKQAVSKKLLACGATIHEINTVRKHLSAIKGGRLAQAARPAAVACLILSDVVGDDLDVIASGPTVPDASSFQDCLQILDYYGLQDQLPSSVCDYLAAGAAGRIPETPKQNTHVWAHVNNVIVANNQSALAAARLKAEALGYRTLVLSARMQGETREVAQVHAAIAQEILASGAPLAPPACLLSGGETTVTLRGDGWGGRNQEFALAAALAIDDHPHIVVLSAGTDGSDGPTDAAGALVDHTTCRRARQAGLDTRHYLSNNDAYRFFESLGGLLKTGPTNTNVMDLYIVLVAPPEYTRKEDQENGRAV
jgi:glycerate 2-kinase